MKILILTNHLNRGGITTYVISLAQGLKENGHTVKVVSRGGERVFDLEKMNIEHIFLDLFTKSEISPKIFCAKRKLFSILKKEKMDLLHPQTRITRVLAQYIYNKSNIPFVSTAHGFYKKRLAHIVFPYWGKRVIAISKAVKEDLVDRFGLKSEIVKVIYNGIDLDKFIPKKIEERKELRKKFGLENGPVIGIISRIAKIKGHEYLIKAMKIILERYSNAKLLILGEGKGKDYLKKMVKDLRMGENVIFSSLNLDTLSLFSLMDVFVLPSLEEGLGMVILEAMASNVPVVATEVGGIPEIIRNGENGLLVPPQDYLKLGEAICKILENSELRDKFIYNGRKTVEENFNLKNMVKETEKVYEEII